MTRALLCGLAVALSACAGGLRPVPPTATPAERLARCEAALTDARGASAEVTVEVSGGASASFRGTLTLSGPSAVTLHAEGAVGDEPVSVSLEARDGLVDRSLTRRSSVAANRDPPDAAPARTLARLTTHLGLWSALSTLATDAPLDAASAAQLQAVDVSNGGPDDVSGVGCHRVDFGVEASGAPLGRASLCVADATGLPLQRRQTLTSGGQETSVVETYRWTLAER